MSRRLMWLGLAAVALVACNDDKPTATAPSASATAEAAKPSATASAAPPESASTAEPAKGKMANCPNTVEGATTEFKEVDKGIEIVVKGKDAAAATEIRARAAHLVAASKDVTAQSKHNGGGQGGGQYGRCPVVMKDTQLASADIEGGAKITVTVKEANEVDWLRREARERNAQLGAPGSEGAGTGKMAHCPSAAEGASTVVKDSKDGVLIVVTAKDEKVTADIRERTKHIVEAAKKDPKDVKHDGAGDGGGSLGRCPVVLKDTKVTAKDVPGGAEISVVPEKKDDLASVRKEARERAEKFNAGAAAPADSANAASAAKPPKK